MNILQIIFGLLLGMLLVQNESYCQQYDPNLKLWYNKPAGVWEEALPLGNAKTGAMVFGGILKERFQLNDNTLWSGYPDPGNNPNGPAVLPQVRAQIFPATGTAPPSFGRRCRGLILQGIFLWQTFGWITTLQIRSPILITVILI